MENRIIKKSFYLNLRVNKLKKINFFRHCNFLFLILFNILLPSYINSSSEIHLIINGTESNQILSDSFSYYPSQVLINENPGTCLDFNCNLDDGLNNVTLIFNENIETCEKMFMNLKNIIEIDLSNFDASHVTNMFSMFLNCENLKNIEFGNFNTSSVNNMYQLFMNCKQITSIDVSSFDTSGVTTFFSIFSH